MKPSRVVEKNPTHTSTIKLYSIGIHAWVPIVDNRETQVTSERVSAKFYSSRLDGAVPVAVEEDRPHLVESTTVLIMKARKALNHNELIAEVTKQLSTCFNRAPQFIKKRIESLIEREY
jgi:hypothetical protein